MSVNISRENYERFTGNIFKDKSEFPDVFWDFEHYFKFSGLDVDVSNREYNKKIKPAGQMIMEKYKIEKYTPIGYLVALRTIGGNRAKLNNFRHFIEFCKPDNFKKFVRVQHREYEVLEIYEKYFNEGFRSNNVLYRQLRHLLRYHHENVNRYAGKVDTAKKIIDLVFNYQNEKEIINERVHERYFHVINIPEGTIHFMPNICKLLN